MNEDSLFKLGIALFTIVSPIGIVPIFISATEGWSHEHRARTAKTVAMRLALRLSGRISARLGNIGISVVRHLMGLILAAMSVDS